MAGWRFGVSTTNFGMVDEALAVMISDEIKDSSWKEYESLAAYVGTVSRSQRGPQRNQEGTVTIDNGAQYVALVSALAERASQEQATDVKKALYKMHFAGGVEAWRYISATFGNEVLTALGRLDIHTVTGRDMLEFCAKAGITEDFERRLGVNSLS